MNDNFFVFSDIHGRYDLWEQVKKYLYGQPAIFLGDAADRGPDGYQIMKELLDSPNIIYLKGNHEDMFVETAKAYFKEKQPTCEFSDIEAFGNVYRLLIYNGGHPTWQAWKEDGCPRDIVNRLNRLPVYFSVGQFDFCHSGCNKAEWENRENIPEKQLFWNRSHFPCDWFKDRILVHGHTPVEHLTCYRNFDHKVVGYNNKIDIDIGAVFCDTVAVYNTQSRKVAYIGVNGTEDVCDVFSQPEYT